MNQPIKSSYWMDIPEVSEMSNVEWEALGKMRGHSMTGHPVHRAEPIHDGLAQMGLIGSSELDGRAWVAEHGKVHYYIKPLGKLAFESYRKGKESNS